MNARNTNSDLEQFLNQLARDARAGDRLPTIRELMQRFGASQVLVQHVFRNLKAKGLIASHVGRGTYFCAAGDSSSTSADKDAGVDARSATVRSVLLLRRSISIVRGRMLVEGLQRRFTADGHRVIEVSYTDPDHACTILKGLPNFDACVIQSTFKTITVDVLAALREKTDVLAVDGAALAGTDVDAVGMEWGEPVATAIALLQQQGHQRIAYATTSYPFLASQLGLRRFEYLKSTLAGAELRAITVPHLPDLNYQESLADMIRASLDTSGRLPFTALVAWGIEDGTKFRRLLSEIGVEIPSTLSVVLLGRTDLANEHADYFDMVGCTVSDQVEYLHQAITARWSDPSIPYGIRLLPLARRVGHSIVMQPKTDQSQAQGSRKPVKARGEMVATSS